MPHLTTADCLPHDIWTAISNLVAAESSIHGLCSLQMVVCWATCDAGHENVVLASVSILESCNPELLFREGPSECFHRCHLDARLDLLRFAALKGHDAAKYAASLVIFLRPADTSAMK
ncbi:hypothetical protein AHAS_Ahas11G0323000 [Arachis hypogaea]